MTEKLEIKVPRQVRALFKDLHARYHKKYSYPTTLDFRREDLRYAPLFEWLAEDYTNTAKLYTAWQLDDIDNVLVAINDKAWFIRSSERENGYSFLKIFHANGKVPAVQTVKRLAVATPFDTERLANEFVIKGYQAVLLDEVVNSNEKIH